MDGSAAQIGPGPRVVLTSPEGDTIEYVVHFGFKASNNEVEYEAAIVGINLCIATGARRIRMTTDS